MPARQRHLSGIIAALLISASAFSLGASRVLSAERTYEFDTITAVDIQAGLNIRITPGEQQLLSVTAREEWDLEHLELSVEEGTLHATQSYSFWDFLSRGYIIDAFFKNEQRLNITLNLPAIEKITAQSGATVFLEDFSAKSLFIQAQSGSNVQAQNLSYQDMILDTSSGGKIDITGTCTTLDASAASGSTLSALSLACAQVQANAYSGATLKVHATQAVTARASSGARIIIGGKPENSDISSLSGGSIAVSE